MMALAAFHRTAFPIACALLLAAAVTAMETLSQPLQSLPSGAVRALVGSIAWTWTLNGLWWAMAAVPLADLPPRRLAALIPPLAVAISLVHLGTWASGLTISLDGGSIDLMGRARQPTALFAHVLWANVFYGGLYLLSFAGSRRAWRSRRLLAELASTRAEIEADQQEARLRALRGQVQPGIVIQALEALQALYANAPRRADALFDELVQFLRVAMPAVRRQSATLGSELTLLGHYAELRRQIGDGGGPLFDAPAEKISDVAFPPLCLLPLVEALACALPPGAPILIRQTSAPGVRIEIPCHGGPLTPEIGAEAERRLRVGLAAQHGGGAQFMIDRRADMTSLVIILPSRLEPAPRPCRATEDIR